MSAAAGLLQTNDVTFQSVVRTQNTERSSHFVRPIRRHRLYVVRDNCDLPFTCACLIPPSALSQEALLFSASPPPFARQDLSPLCAFFLYPSFPVPVLAFQFGLATWVQSSHPASPRPSSGPGEKLVLTHRPLSSLPLYAAVRQVWGHDRWYERSGLGIQLEVHRQGYRIYP